MKLAPWCGSTTTSCWLPPPLFDRCVLHTPLISYSLISHYSVKRTKCEGPYYALYFKFILIKHREKIKIFYSLQLRILDRLREGIAFCIEFL